MKNIAITNRPLVFHIKRNNDPIKESTIRKLKELGIYDSSIQTETEAQQLIKAKLQEIARKKNKKAIIKEDNFEENNLFDLTNEILANYNKAML